MAIMLFGWHYLIFLLPLGAAALLLALSSLRPGGARHGHPHAGGHSGHGGHARTHHAHGVKAAGHHRAPAKPGAAKHAGPSLVATLTGVGPAPLPLVAGAFCLCWGIAGFFANQALLHTPTPTPVQVLPSLGIALLGGLVGGRLAAATLGRLLPEEHTSVLSRDALYGLTGRVVFPVSETGGRVRVYDEHKTLHDEPCRVASGHTPVGKGREVIVVDRDAAGNLIVEELNT